MTEWLGGETRVDVVPVSRDTPDWTLLSFWAHPERVLDRAAREATSGFARMPKEVVARVVADVDRDLRSGAWDARHGHLRSLDALDVGLRMVVSRPQSRRADRLSTESRQAVIRARLSARSTSGATFWRLEEARHEIEEDAHLRYQVARFFG